MQVNDLAKWVDELQGNISVIKQQLAALSGSVADVPDFKITTPSSGQVLSYDSEHSKFVNTDLPDLPEFNITSPEDGQVLIYDENADDWKNGVINVNNYSKTLLYNTPITGAGQIDVDADISTFDIVELWYEAKSASSGASMAIWVDAQMLASCAYSTSSSNKHVYIYISGSEFARLTMGDEVDKLNFFDNATIKITAIYGIKY